MKKNGDIVTFLRQKNYVMEDNNLGKGAFGKTVLLSDPQLGNEKFVAKKYEPQLASDAVRFFQRFCDEIKIMLRLNHKNIVRIYNWLLLEDLHTGFIVMEYIEGKDIGKYIKEYNPKYFSSTLDDLFLQLLDAFSYMEQNKIIHRDIRETNILITKAGVVKVIDFGLGKIMEASDGSEKDTLKTLINRDGLDIHPQEYYDGTYTSQTDMFYLAELFFRLLHASQKEQFFSYLYVLEKMKSCKPNERFKSFSEVKESIFKQVFENITDDDCFIYKSVIDPLYASIESFSSVPKFENDISKVINQLSLLLSKNCLEHFIQKNNDLISIFVLTGYKYYDKDLIPIISLRNFYAWFCALDQKMQNLVLDNISYKLGKKKVKEVNLDDDMPF